VPTPDPPGRHPSSSRISPFSSADDSIINSKKSRIRKQLIERRNALPPEIINDLSILIQQAVIKSEQFHAAKTIGAYFPVRSEVRTNLLFDEIFKLEKRLALPKVNGHRIDFFRILSLNDQYFVKGRYGIKEPGPLDPADKIDLLVVPGIAFDKEGHRLGYGKGYYDRFLTSEKPIYSIGLCFEFQLLKHVPHGRSDKRLNAVATETGMYHCI